MSVRDMGKGTFAVIQDAVGKIQIYIKQDDICPGEDKSLFQNVWKKPDGSWRYYWNQRICIYYKNR